MQKHKFNITYPDAPVWYLRWAQPSMKNSVSTFHGPDTTECTTCPQIAPDAKTQVKCNVSRRAFCGIRTGPTRA
jgi:hypothetical protein